MDKKNVRTESENLWIALYCDSDDAHEIANNQAFTANDLWIRIEGVVGIFLGYSCLQVTFDFIFAEGNLWYYNSIPF